MNFTENFSEFSSSCLLWGYFSFLTFLLYYQHIFLSTVLLIFGKNSICLQKNTTSLREMRSISRQSPKMSADNYMDCTGKALAVT